MIRKLDLDLIVCIHRARSILGCVELAAYPFSRSFAYSDGALNYEVRKTTETLDERVS